VAQGQGVVYRKLSVEIAVMQMVLNLPREIKICESCMSCDGIVQCCCCKPKWGSLLTRCEGQRVLTQRA